MIKIGGGTFEKRRISLKPDPRILEMLGRIELKNWQCLAELIDNPIDAITDSGIGKKIWITTPTQRDFDESPDPQIIVNDDGPGMGSLELERNLRAGYSGRDPEHNLGLFGMGFNIATARLGEVTTVQTTQKGDNYWRCVVIDLPEMARTKSYDRPIIMKEKDNPEIHGTRVIIGGLRPERTRTIRKQPTIKKKLNRIYTPLLAETEITISIDGYELDGRGHCVWSGERYVERQGRRIPSKIKIEENLGEEYFCKTCLGWIEEDEAPPQEDVETVVCPICGPQGDVVKREQRIWGWLGVQRYYDKKHYGVDLVRNGRVIEELDKSLFYWTNDETGERELEYPIDAIHWGGRIVGEIHVNFVPVTYTKDHFEKQDVRWKKVRDYLRGKAPIRPKVAKRRGYSINRSPLARLFEGYRKGNAPGKTDLLPGRADGEGGVKGMNKECQRMAEKFWEGEEDYQDDSKWWELVEQAERLQRGEEAVEPIEVIGPQPPEGEEEEEPEEELELEEVPSLSDEILLDQLGEQPIKLQVKKLVSGDLGGTPTKSSARREEIEVIYDPDHDLLTGFGIQPVDLVYIEVSHILSTRTDDPQEWPPSRIFYILKEGYRPDDKLSPLALEGRAKELIAEIREYAAGIEIKVDEDEVGEPIREKIRREVFDRLGEGEEKVSELLETSEYLRYSPEEEVVRFVNEHPEVFLDGKYWECPLKELGSDKLKENTKKEFASYLEDVLWLSRKAGDYEVSRMGRRIRKRLTRASYSLRILRDQRAE